MNIRAVAGEVLRAWSAHRIQNVSLVLLAAAATCAIVLTSGRSAGLERDVLSTIDRQGPRTIAVQAKGQFKGFDTSLVDVLGTIPNVDRIVGFGKARDATLPATPSGPRIAVRYVYPSMTPLGEQGPPLPSAQLSATAMRKLGLTEARGTLRVIDGEEFVVSGTMRLPEFLRPLEPLALVQHRSAGADEPITSIYVLAASTQDLRLVMVQIQSYLADFGTDDVGVSTSPQLAALNDAISGSLTARNRSTLLALTGVGAALIGTATFGFVMNQRKSYGRRRALGASRSLLLALVVGEVGLAVLLGSVLGTTAGSSWLRVERNPLPSPDYLFALVVLVSSASVAIAFIPGWFAASRDPVAELRVP